MPALMVAPTFERGCKTVKVWSAWPAPQMPQQPRCQEIEFSNIFVPVCDRPSVADPTEAQDCAVMETKNAAIHRKMLMLVSQLPITGSAHKAAVVGDPLMAAVLAGLDMTAQSRGAAPLDCGHDFELMKAQVSGMGDPISGAGGTEDIGDLERGAHRLSRRVRSLRP